MSDTIELSEINLDEGFGVGGGWSADRPTKTANFGGGIELLMNDRKREGGGRQTSDIDLDDLTNLEKIASWHSEVKMR